MNVKFVEKVSDNVGQKNVFHLQNFRASPAHPSDRSSMDIMAL
jgi:hypothetical protein